MTAPCQTCGNADAVIEDYCVACDVAFYIANPDEFDPDYITPFGEKFWELTNAHKDAAEQIKAALAPKDAA